MIIWDLPLRIFHWSFMICVIGAIVSGKMAMWDIHERFGLGIMGLVIFRVIWGFIGSDTARFATFLQRPKAFISGLVDLWRKSPSRKAGHSAVGGYATIVLLIVPFMMALTGGFNTDDILYDGPFYHLMPDWAKQAGIFHHFGEKIIFLIILLHLGALGYYYFTLKKNLIPPMITGKPSAKTHPPEGKGGALSRGRTLFGLILMAALVALAQSASQLRPDFF